MIRQSGKLLSKRKLANLPQIPVDGTRVTREAFPQYCKYALIAGGLSMAGLTGYAYHLYPTIPEHSYKDLMEVKMPEKIILLLLK